MLVKRLSLLVVLLGIGIAAHPHFVPAWQVRQVVSLQTGRGGLAVQTYPGTFPTKAACEAAVATHIAQERRLIESTSGRKVLDVVEKAPHSVLNGYVCVQLSSLRWGWS